jgi:putative phage-type endonuclease
VITDLQRQSRKKHIGSSDVAAILGLDPFRNAYEVFLEKTGKLDDKEKAGRAINLGSMLEHAIIRMAEDRLGKIVRNQYRTVKDFPVLAASTDGIVKSSGEPVEAKSTNITYRAPESDHWGDEGTDQVPERVIIQCTVQMMATESSVCHNPVIIGGRGFVMFRVPFDKDLAEMILERVAKFWEFNVQGDRPPENCVPSMEVVKRVRRIPEKTVDIADGLVKQWQAAREYRLEWEKKEEKAQAEMLAALGLAEAGKFSDGLLTYFRQSRESLDVARLKAENPKIAAEYMKTTAYRVPRVKKLLLKG